MQFVDQVVLRIRAGDGGPGAVAFRREKFVPRGGPSGGDGGDGADVVLRADENVGTLLDLRYRKQVDAPDGKPGQNKNKHGAAGEDIILRVPVGTVVRDAETMELLTDLDADGAAMVIARGGKGGRGNARFKGSVRQAPRFAQPGLPGEARTVVLELKLLADIGIIGFPSVGKSTLISVISNAKPKIAAYHFTTLTPNLGLVEWRDYRSFVVADIPGLIEGAHEGAGLGHQFLRHVERCRAFCHVIEVTPQLEGVPTDRDPVREFDAICQELAHFSPPLAARPQIVALGKMDLPFVQEREPELRALFEARGHTFVSFSAATGEGVDTLIDAMGQLVEETPAPEPAEFRVPHEVVDELPRDDDPEEPDDGAEVVWVFEE